MREPLSREFIVSFVETCMDMGLSKEATAEMLQRRSAIHAAEQSPAFAEGYLKAQEQIPISDRIRVRPGYVEKRAFGAAAKLIGRSIGGIASGVGGLGMAAGRGLVNTAVNNPRAAKALAGTALLGGGGFALGQMNRDKYSSPGVPYLPPGGYNPEEEKKRYKTDLNQYTEGIARNNKIIDGAANRRKVLQQSVDANSPDSAKALAELRQLDAEVKAAEKQNAAHRAQLDSQGSTAASRLQSIQERQQTLRDRSKSPFWRGLHWMTFRNPDKAYAQALDELQPAAARLSYENQLMNDQRGRMDYGYKGIQYNEPSSSQMQREFFPTYR